MTKNRTFLGMTIEGDIYKNHRNEVTPLTPEEVNRLILAVMDCPEVRGLCWNQYTPYYSDGDSCVFSAAHPSISIKDAEKPNYFENGWMEDDFEETGRVWLDTYDESFERLVGDDDVDWSGVYPNRVATPKIKDEDQPNPRLFRAFLDLTKAMNSGSCDHVLLDLFGDHAQVVLDKEADKVLIETYEHD